MAEPTSVALVAASIPSSADIARAEKFVRERFLHDGEDPAVALAAGHAAPAGARPGARRAREDARPSIPSTAWRREFSLLLGLERVLSEDEPKLVDGTVLSAHQVDALSGTLTALLAEALRSTAENGNGTARRGLARAAGLGRDLRPRRGRARGGSRRGGSGQATPRGRPLAGEDDDEPDDEPERARTTRTTTSSAPCSAPPPTRTRR